MGAAESKNVSSSVTKLSNTIQQSTKADTTQVNNLTMATDFTNCTIKLDGDLNVTKTADLMVSNSQIAEAKQDANLQNNVAQTALQEAKSTVGALGVGYASASNAASQLVDVSNQITNNLFVSAGQFSNTSQTFTCNNSFIQARNLNIDFKSKADFLSQQALKNEQIAKVTNDITQTIDQKATATIEGLTGLLLMILLIICVIVYVIFKPLDSGAGKILMVAIIFCIIVGVIVWMWATGQPPLFGKPDQCISSSKTGVAEGDKCKNISTGEIEISNPPLRYSYPVFQIGGVNLVQMAIAKVSGVSEQNAAGINNGGYNINVMNKLQNLIDSNYSKYVSDLNEIGIIPPDKIPNPLMNPQQDNNQMYVIPSEYGTDSSSAGKCTPKIIQVLNNSQNISIKDCPTEINPSALSSTSMNPQNSQKGIANLNTTGWNEYLGLSNYLMLSPNEIKRRNDFARFCLCDILDIELNIYVDGNEYVRITNNFGNSVIRTGETEPDKSVKFVPSKPVSDNSGSITGGGTVKGEVGTVNNSTNNLRSAALWVVIPIMIIIFIFFIYFVFRKKEKKTGQ